MHKGMARPVRLKTEIKVLFGTELEAICYIPTKNVCSICSQPEALWEAKFKSHTLGPLTEVAQEVMLNKPGNWSFES